MRPLILILISFQCFLFTDSFSQQDKTNNQIITISELSILAESADFEGSILTEIYKDKKSTFFAIDRNALESRYLELRILEQVYSDKIIVHIGGSEPYNFLLFAADNKFNEENGNLLKKLNKFYTVAMEEKSNMDEEQLRNWINKHDKSAKAK